MLPYALIDLHCDTLTALLDPTRCRDTLNDPLSQLSLQNLPQNVHWAQCCAVFIPDGLTPEESVGYYRFHQRSFARQMNDLSKLVLPCRTAEQIKTAWAQNKTAALLTIENASALGRQPERAEQLAQDGVVMMTLTWNGENLLGSGHSTQHGLSPFGREAVAAMEHAGILADVSHLNDQGLDDMLAISSKPFVASHSNARAVCGHTRNLSDPHIREMTARHCLIGLNYCSPFLRDDGQNAGPEDLLRHIEHLLDLGAADCLALGSDFDGSDLPPQLDSPAKAANLYDFLLNHGIPQPLADKILYRNALEFFQQNLP